MLQYDNDGNLPGYRESSLILNSIHPPVHHSTFFWAISNNAKPIGEAIRFRQGSPLGSNNTVIRRVIYALCSIAGEFHLHNFINTQFPTKHVSLQCFPSHSLACRGTLPGTSPNAPKSRTQCHLADYQVLRVLRQRQRDLVLPLSKPPCQESN